MHPKLKKNHLLNPRLLRIQSFHYRLHHKSPPIKRIPSQVNRQTWNPFLHPTILCLRRIMFSLCLFKQNRLNKVLSTVGEETESNLSDEEQEEDQDLDEFRQSVVAARMSKSNLESNHVFTFATSESEPSPSPSASPSSNKNQSIPPLIVPSQDDFKKQIVYPSTHTSLKEKRVSALRILKPSTVSALSQMVDLNQESNNPFSRDYSFFAGKSDANPLKLVIYLPFSEKNPSMTIYVKHDANVQDVIGYSLFEYTDRDLEPPVPSALHDTSLWSIRIVEDDGTIDEDFPALDRQRQIEKFGCDCFALCPSMKFDVARSAPSHSKPPIHTRNQSSFAGALPKSAESSYMGDSLPMVFLKVQVYPSPDSHQVQNASALQVPSQTLCREVLNQVCIKHGLDPKAFVLKMADTKTDVPLDKTVEKLKITEFSIVKKAKTGAGEIPQATESLFQPSASVKSFGLQAEPAFKEYSVLSKHLMGKYERILTLDGDYIRLVSSSKNFFDMEIGKTVSHHASTVLYCRHSKNKKRHIKLQVKCKSHELKLYELEASSMDEAEEICKKINALKLKTLMNGSNSSLN